MSAMLSSQTKDPVTAAAVNRMREVSKWYIYSNLAIPRQAACCCYCVVFFPPEGGGIWELPCSDRVMMLLLCATRFGSVVPVRHSLLHSRRVPIFSC